VTCDISVTCVQNDGLNAYVSQHSNSLVTYHVTSHVTYWLLNRNHYNSCKSWPIKTVELVPETVKDSKQDTICFALFVLVCRSKFRNSAEPWPIEMVGLVPETGQDSKQDTIWAVITGLVCEFKFTNFAETWAIELVNLLWKQCKTNQIQSVFILIVCLNLATLLNQGQLRWLDLSVGCVCESKFHMSWAT
jgi:hypothetical protein